LKPKIKLPFVGYATTGGVDTDVDGNFWVENAFSNDRFNVEYCSRDNAKNPVLAAMLEPCIQISKNRRRKLNQLQKHTLQQTGPVSAETMVKLYEEGVSP
jgi:hypothetical protein